MDQIIKFDKTYQERLLDYTDVLSGYESLPASQIEQEWSFYLELTVDKTGWQAIWKIPRLKCEKLKIAFPTIVLVYVQNVEFKELTASVKILAVQDDVSLPDNHYVPLMQLWPTKEQDKSFVLNLESTANSLDMLRFFYQNVFMPWDEDDDTTNWLSKHLESRLRLFYDMINGTIPAHIAEHLRSKLTEARRLQALQEDITQELDENEDTIVEPSKQSPTVQKLLNIQVRLLQIRNEVELLENPMYRNVLIANQNLPKATNNDVKNWVVFDQGKITDYIEFLQQVKTHANDENAKYVSTLSLALKNINVNDTVFLSQCNHVFSTLGNLQDGGILKGFSSKDTSITSTNEDIMLDCCGNMIFENITINVDSAQCGILARRGAVTLNNCKIITNTKSSIRQGIIVLSGSTLNLFDCDISGFYTSIVGNSGANISIKNCKIHSSNFGLKIYDKCNVNVESTVFQNCVDYGICVETDTKLENARFITGEFSVLEMFSNIQVCNTTVGIDNKENVIINTKVKLEPIKDLFSNVDADPSTVHNKDSSDEEMETSESILENTVIQRNS